MVEKHNIHKIAGISQKRKSTFIIVMIILLILLVFLILASMCIGPAPLSFNQVVDVVIYKLPFLNGNNTAEIDDNNVTIVWDHRLGRNLVAVLVGISLAVSGAVFQGLFRNPLADPFIIGASSGAALGSTLAIVFGFSVSFLGFTPIPFAAFLGAIFSVALVYAFTRTGSNSPPAVVLLLAGTALGSLFFACVSIIMALSENDLHKIFFWLLGSLNGRTWTHLFVILPYFIISLIIIVILARPLEIMAFGEETASGMGLNVKHARILIIISASLATASAVSISGIIGFVGLIAPHIARLLFGPAHKRLIPASAVIGAILLVISDNLARTLLGTRELPIGVLTALLGAPFFLYLLKSRQSSLGGE